MNNINMAISNCANIIKSLKTFPVFPKIKFSNDKYITNEMANVLRNELLKKCIPTINELKKEIEEELNGFGNIDLESIGNRRNNIKKKHEELLLEIESNSEKYKLINKIEEMEDSINKTYEKIIFDENETMKLIEKVINEDLNGSENEELNKIISENIILKFEEVGTIETETLRRIINIIDNN